ncbi:MAG: zinc ribbon domain-containing protein [Haloarculaceae archaeon]
MSDAPADPRCPECGGPIGVTATYCMHCSADLTEERERADADGDGTWDRAEAGSANGTATGTGATPSTGGGDTGTGSDELLDDEGLVDNTLTVLVGIVAGIVVGVIGTVVLLAVTGSGAAVVFGLLAWLGSTAYLVRRRTVQGAVSKAGYAVAAVLLLVPFVAVSPFVDVDGGIEGRVGGFVVLLVFVAVPAGIAAVVGVVASRFVPDRGR